MQDIVNQEPQSVWKFFNEILQIPRPSKKEEKIIHYLKEFAKSRSLKYKEDKAGNLLIFKPASRGMENRPTVILQSHVDMVCEKNSGTAHNFDTDPIKAFIEDGWIKAADTTLGADNGIGIAAQLAVLDDNSLLHGPVECLFTVDEETGLTGAFGLSADFLTGSILLNLDSEDDGEIFIGCAGGIDTLIRSEYETSPTDKNQKGIKLQVKGLAGGHSGDDINKGRGNANKIIARTLFELTPYLNYQLCTIGGGNLRNAIPREAETIISINPGDLKTLEKRIREVESAYKGELCMEKNLKIEMKEVDIPEHGFSQKYQNALISCLYACPNGVIEMSQNIQGLVETSTNLASIRTNTEEGTVKIVTSQRSSVETAKFDTAARLKALFEMIGAEVTHSDAYPGWTPNPDSNILRLSEEVYTRLFNDKPEIKAIHAGLECGLFLSKYPNLDMISFGPTIRGAHSPDERMEIATVDRFWKLLIEILKEIPAYK